MKNPKEKQKFMKIKGKANKYRNTNYLLRLNLKN